MDEYKGIEYLRRKLSQKQPRVRLRYRYYEAKNEVVNFSKLMPRGYDWMAETLGWCTKAVDSLADRLIFKEFRDDNFNLNGIYRLNNPDILFDSAILSAAIASCCFLYISPGEADFTPRIQVIDGGNATGIIEPMTGLLREGYAVLERDKSGKPISEAHFIPYRTEYFEGGKLSMYLDHAAPFPLLAPIVYRPDAVRPFGHSRISRACMALMQGALRTLLRSEISSEFYSFPQKYVLGLDEDAEFDNAKASYSAFLSLGSGADGQKPTVGQFQQQSMSPHTEQLRTFAAAFAGETGLTLDDLGFVADNPSSSEAIKASHETLRLTAKKAQRTFGSGFLNAGYLAACIRDDFPYRREELYRTKPVWQPIFDPDSGMLSSLGDAIIKINQASPGYLTDEKLYDLLGI